MSELNDQFARDQAIRADGSFIVQAPAGSGKTGLITQRILNLLSFVEQPEDILAITFTRKAANEMRLRVMEALAQGEGKAPDAEYEKRSWRLARSALNRNKEKDWDLLKNPKRLRIQTIDSLSASLVRQMPILSEFGVQPGIVERPDELYREAIEWFIRSVLIERDLPDLESDVMVLLKTVNNQLSLLVDLLQRLLSKRDQWIRHFIVNEKLLDQHALEDALAFFINNELQLLDETLPQGIGFEIIEQLNGIIDGMKTNDDPYQLHLLAGLQTWPSCDVSELTQWQIIAQYLLTGKDTIRARWTKKEGFVAPSSLKDKSEKAQAKQIKDKWESTLAELSENVEFVSALAKVKQLPKPEYSEQQWELISSLNRCLNFLLVFLKLTFKNRNHVDFTELSLAALTALNDPTGATDLALKLDYQIHHILVDEFQDTSHSQYELLRLLTQEWMPDDGKTLFVVGDPMQSIYRFREADVGLYLNCREYGLSGISLTPLFLSSNFRSHASIVNWVNNSFQRIFPKKENALVGAVSFSEATATNTKNDNEVTVLHDFNAEDDAQVNHVFNVVQTHFSLTPKKSIAVLVRSKSHAQPIIQRLKQENIPVEAVEMELLHERPMMLDLRNLARLLLNPYDRLALAGLLRSPICGLSLTSMFSIFSKTSDVWLQIKQLIDDNVKGDVLECEQKQRLILFYDSVHPFIKFANGHLTGDILWRCWIACGGLQLNAALRDIKDAEQFIFALQSKLADQSIYTVSQLDALLESLFSLPDIDADNAVKIMSIHKSKGLEFDTVILPFLDRRPRSDDSELLLWQELMDDEQNSDLLVAPIKVNDDEQDKIVQLLKSINAQKNEMETARLLYVAVTRAKEKLVLVSQSNAKEKDEQVQFLPPAKNSLLSHLWDVIQPSLDTQSFKAFHTDRELVDEHQKNTYLVRRLVNQAPIVFEHDLAPLDSTLSSDQETDSHDEDTLATLLGTLYHTMIERILEDGVTHWTAERVKGMTERFSDFYRQQFVLESFIAGLVERTIEALTLTLSDPKGQWILSEHTESKSELAMTTYEDGQFKSYVIDRTFIDENDQRWIIDFKTSQRRAESAESFESHALENYREQMEQYARLFADIEARTIKTALYYPFEQKMFEYLH